MNNDNSSTEKEDDKNSVIDNDIEKLPKVVYCMNSESIDDKLREAKIDAEIRAYHNIVNL